MLNSDRFTASFDFQVTEQGGIGWGDGFTFALIDAATNGDDSLGEIGSGLGYDGLSGLAIEFDTYTGNTGDPSHFHVGLDVGGSVTSVQTSGPLPFPITESGWLTAEITLSAGMLVVSLAKADGKSVAVLTTSVPEGALPNEARVGFTAATAISNLRSQGVGPVSASPPPLDDPMFFEEEGFFDVDGNNLREPLDAVRIISFLRNGGVVIVGSQQVQQNAGFQSEGESPDSVSAAQPSLAVEFAGPWVQPSDVPHTGTNHRSENTVNLFVPPQHSAPIPRLPTANRAAAGEPDDPMRYDRLHSETELEMALREIAGDLSTAWDAETLPGVLSDL